MWTQTMILVFLVKILPPVQQQKNGYNFILDMSSAQDSGQIMHQEDLKWTEWDKTIC